MTLSSFTWWIYFIGTMTLVLLHSLSSFAVGAPHAICPKETIMAFEGANISLPCRLLPPDNLVNYTADWKRVEVNKVVHSYRHKKDNHDDQMEVYRGRTVLNHEALRGGVLTLHISSVKRSDSGGYKCNVPKLTTSCIIELIVEGEDSPSTGPPEKEETEQNNPDAPKNKTLIAIICSIAAFAAVVLILVGCGPIQVCRKGREAEGHGDGLEM